MSATGFRKQLEHIINCESRENGSGTPDFILADYLVACLAAFDAAVVRREQWYGRDPAGLIGDRPAPDASSTVAPPECKHEKATVIHRSSEGKEMLHCPACDEKWVQAVGAPAKGER